MARPCLDMLNYCFDIFLGGHSLRLHNHSRLYLLFVPPKLVALNILLDFGQVAVSYVNHKHSFP